MPLQAQAIQWESILAGEDHSDDVSGAVSPANLTPGEQGAPIQGHMPVLNQAVQVSCSNPEPVARQDTPWADRIASEYARKLLRLAENFRKLAHLSL